MALERVNQNEWLGVLGGATHYTPEQIIAGYRVGCEVARLGRGLITGGTTGVPYAAAIGARENGALVVGISPAASPKEHAQQYQKPLDSVDLLVYTGMSVEGRSPLIIRSVVGMFFIGGEFGTLNEFSAAWLCGEKVLGILEGIGGITDQFRGLIERIESTWGNQVLFDVEPEQLVQRVCGAVEDHSRRACDNESGERPGEDVRDMIRRYASGGSGA